MPAPSFAFIGWNPFQFRHVLDIARAVENSCLVIEKRMDHIFKFDEDLITDAGVPVIIWPRNRVSQLDGFFDIIVCQTPFSQMEEIRKSRIAMIQYGYAKEAHNYGAWRSAASLCMAYGDYAAGKLRPLCPVVVTGNPALDAWHDPRFHQSAKARLGPKLDPSRKTILYAPTWGDLATTDLYLEEVMALAGDYNVVLKLHHNTDLLEKETRRHLTASSPVFFGANDSLMELMSLSDLVLSDYSGAIFDALYCRRPVVLLHGPTEKRFGEKLSPESIEYAARHRIGPVIERTGILRQTVSDVLDGRVDFTSANQQLVNELYLPGPGAVERAAQALRALAATP